MKMKSLLLISFYYTFRSPPLHSHKRGVIRSPCMLVDTSRCLRCARHSWADIQESFRRKNAQELKINQSSQCPYVVVCYHSFYDNVLKGLLYLHHERHIIHKDLKPSNLLINHRGEVKITDFGVSTIMESTSSQASTLLGTYKYMSSLWLVLLECATRHFPYIPPEGNEGWTNFFELMDSIVSQPPPFAPSRQFSPKFCSFISKHVQKDPQNRQSMHPFITMYENLDVNLKSYFTNMLVNVILNGKLNEYDLIV
ncbi:hypothetical protein UlMin_039630 [Ulmus minor]